MPAPPTASDIDRAGPPPAAAGAPATLAVTGGPRAAACPLAAAPFATQAIAFRAARFDHLRGLDADALRPAWEAFAGRTIPLSDLCAIRDAATAILTRAGYVAAVTVPAQAAEDGTVAFEVVMARLVRVEVRGGARERRLAAYLAKLTERPLFNTREAERYLLLARELPGYDATLALTPADGAPGDVVGVLTARARPWTVEANAQNYGSKPVGRWGGAVTAALNDPTGSGDRLTLGLFANAPVREQVVAQAGYERRIGGEGLTLGVRGTYARTRPAVGDGDPFRSHTLVGGIDATYPWRRGRGLDVAGRAGFEVVDQDLRAYGTTLTRDRLRTAYAALDLAAADRPTAGDPRWRAGGTFELRQGIAGLGASRGCRLADDALVCPTPLPSRLRADTGATVLRFTGYAEWTAAPRLTIVAAPRLQYGFAPLVSYEQYSGGAYTIGRGYDPGAVTGDSGAGTSLELRWDARRAVPGRAGPTLQPYAFADAAWVWNRDALPGERYPQRITSVGAGLRASLGERLRLDLAAATPLTRAPDQVVRGQTRVLVSIATRLGPR